VEDGRMEKTPEQRLQYTQAVSIAHSMALKMLIPALVPDAALRKEMRNRICDAMEKMYEEPNLKPRAHFALQAAIAEVEELFQA
jgi:hypothetical protein